MPRNGIVNVRMVITEEKILSNIEKVQKLINPKSKKQIVELDDNSYFRDLIESIKTYLTEYPKKKNFPASVYDEAFKLVEYATNQFDESTKKIEELLKQKAYNVRSASILKQTVALAKTKDPGWKKAAIIASQRIASDILEPVTTIGSVQITENNEEYNKSLKFLNARILNLQSNLHIEIDIERYEDRLKALSFIGIEIADALKLIPVPVDSALSKNKAQVTVKNDITGQVKSYDEITVAPVNRMQTKPMNIVPKYGQNSNQNINNKVAINQFQSGELLSGIEQTKPKVEAKVIRPKANYNVANVANITNEQTTIKVNLSVGPTEKLKQMPMINDTIVKENQVSQMNVKGNNYNQIIDSNINRTNSNVVIVNKEDMNNMPKQHQDFGKLQEFDTPKKPSLWERFKNSRFIKAIQYVFRIKVNLALPEANTSGYDR